MLEYEKNETRSHPISSDSKNLKLDNPVSAEDNIIGGLKVQALDPQQKDLGRSPLSDRPIKVTETYDVILNQTESSHFAIATEVVVKTIVKIVPTLTSAFYCLWPLITSNKARAGRGGSATALIGEHRDLCVPAAPTARPHAIPPNAQTFCCSMMIRRFRSFKCCELL
ncbi:hypothetical protein EVAR_31922_1 [Eumeta japonica]|uniref:Uncharacterized protein n=1 Tax=Eumeta variegata TaxID=151549 RepID=A0A4C1XNT6_EUMVA|nr:hypothetical protein EVAR_31922_1 [Eumeta japonica]